MNFALRTNDDFVVREVIDDKFLRKFERTSSGVRLVKGRYSLYLMMKSGENTRDVIRKICERTGARDVGYAGLKDKNAVTYQYITVKDSSFDDLDMGNISVSFVSKTANHISVGDLKGNDFEITLHECTEIEKLEDFARSVRDEGFYNFFGRQRFGVNADNYMIGRCMVKGDMKKAGKAVECQTGKGMSSLQKAEIKFFIHSYQSWIFNCVLQKCIENRNVPVKLPLVGYGSRIQNPFMKSFLAMEGVSPDDFMLRGMRICCRGSERQTRVKTTVSYAIKNSTALLKFFLPKGSYATVLLDEMKKM
ncbi:MAG: tRNA pseudouridine(13) synthase TruD [Candidatus Aenigmarchaeota archaeon]|nr:tRNA pseudouridine(13) synthase TruD [Candidatus Aenigmarchaeota archaeon]